MKNNTLSPEEEAQVEDFQEQLGIDPETPLTHTLLEIWSKILESIETSKTQKITPLIANRIRGHWPSIEFKELPTYWERYHAFLGKFREILLDQIKKNPKCLTHIEDDAEKNRDIYLELLFLWSEASDRWSDEWDTTHPEAHIDLAAIADASNFVLGDRGLAEHLSQPQLNFEFTDADRETLAARLSEAAEERNRK